MEKQEEKPLEERRLWIGNLDERVTEYQLLKLVQKHGNIEKFDLIFHRSGPQIGQPKGYAFVSYVNRSDAVRAMNALNGSLLGHKKVTVTWAHAISTEEVEKPKKNIVIPALAMSKNDTKSDRETQIQAIEAKLRMMDKKREEELKINDTVATKPPVIAQFQYNKDHPSKAKSKSTSQRKHERKPYSKQSKMHR